MSKLANLIGRILRKQNYDTTIGLAVTDDGSENPPALGEPTPLRADPATGALKVTAVASEGGATPALVVPGDSDPNIGAIPSAARLQAWRGDETTGVWYRIRVVGAAPAADDLGVVVRHAGPINAITQPAEGFAATANPEEGASGAIVYVAGTVSLGVSVASVGEGENALTTLSYQAGAWTGNQGDALAADKQPWTVCGSDGLDYYNLAAESTAQAIATAQTDGSQRSIVRGGAKGATAAADITSTAEGADHQALDVQAYHGGAAIDPREMFTNGAALSQTNPARVLSTATRLNPSYVRFGSQDGFGRPAFVEITPVVQATFANGMKSSEWESYTTLTGTVTTTAESDGLGYARTGANASSIAERRSVSAFTYRAGQSFEVMFTTVFSAPASGGTQAVGAGSNDGVAVGYNGTAFGFLIRSGGKSEQRVLTITTASTTNENITITLDGVAKTGVAVTNSGVAATTAREISAADYSATGAGWDAYQLGSTVVFISRRAAPRTGSYSITATTAVGSFAQQLAGATPTDNWYAKTAWNGDRLDGSLGDNNPSLKTLDPTKGQIWKVIIPHLGFGSIDLYWQNPSTGEFTLCHRQEFANVVAVPNLANPTLRLWIYAAGAANITSASRSMVLACHGPVQATGRVLAIPAATKTNIGTTLTPVITIRTERFDNGNVNRSPYKPLIVMMTAATTGEVVVQAYMNATLTGANFTSHPNDPVMAYDTSATAFSGGVLVGSFNTSRNGSGIPIDLTGKGLALQPGYTVTFVAMQNSGNNGVVIIAVDGFLDNGSGAED